LHDNQADICLIKISAIINETEIKTTEKIHVIGITPHKVTAVGSFDVQLQINSYKIIHKFFVMPDDINIPTHGILGKDFLKIQYKTHINHEKMKIILKINNEYTEIPILESISTSLNILYLKPHTDRSSAVLNELQKECNLPNDDIRSLCNQYTHIFHLKSEPLTVNNFFKYTIKLKDQEPVYIKNYRTAHSQRDEIQSQVDDLLQSGQIERSIAPYNSPLLLVPKKSVNGQAAWRLCVDYRCLNKKLINDTYPLPRIDDILDELGETQFFSILDFHQIPLTEECRDFTTFSTQAGSFRYKVLPFGLKIAPSAFARMINTAFSSLPYRVCFIYLDDIIIVGRDSQEHLKNIEKVFKICEQLCLKLNPSKCKFFETQVIYLGHKCSNAGVSPDEHKFDAITNYPRPQTKDEAKRFVAFANYYRRFIKNFATISAPISNLTRKLTEYKWTNECEHNFQQIKATLTSPKLLQYPDFTQTFILTCDASKIACGAVLSQIRNGNDMPIAHASKSFTKGESNKAPIEQELLAIFYAIKHFRPYIYGTHFIIKTDHRPLVYLFSLKDPSSRLTRIRLELEEYDFEIQYIKGETNVVADALSRITVQDLKEINAYVLVVTRSMTRAQRDGTRSAQGNSHSTEISAQQTGVHTAQGSDQRTSLDDPSVMVYEPLNITKTKLAHMKTHDVSETIEKRADRTSPTINVYKNFKSKKPLLTVNLSISTDLSTIHLGDALTSLDTLALGHNIKEITLSLSDDIFSYIAPDIFKTVGNAYLKNTKILLTKTIKTITDDDEILTILNRFHNDPIDGGHPGQKRLLAKIAIEYQWKNMRKDVAKFVNNCHLCSINKPKKSTTHHKKREENMSKKLYTESEHPILRPFSHIHCIFYGW
jgi:hypothetical protein